MIGVMIRIDIHVHFLSEESSSLQYRIEPMEPSDPRYWSRINVPSTKLLPQKAGRAQKQERETFRKLRDKVRDDLYDLTGVDVVLLATQKIKRYFHVQSSIYSMHCARCGKTWADGVGLARHHRIPTKLCRALGLSGNRLGQPENL